MILKRNDGISLIEMLKQTSRREDIAFGAPSLEKVSLPPLPNPDLPTESTGKCKFYENGKCLKTRAFCDLCQDEDEINLVRGYGRIQKSRKRTSSPLRSGLPKLFEKFAFTSRNY
jgi:hypothetical protein